MNRRENLTPQTFAVKVLPLGQWRPSAHKNVLSRHIRRIPSVSNPADLREVTKLWARLVCWPLGYRLTHNLLSEWVLMLVLIKWPRSWLVCFSDQVTDGPWWVGSPQKLVEREVEHEGIHRGGLMFPPQGQLPDWELFLCFYKSLSRAEIIYYIPGWLSRLNWL